MSAPGDALPTDVACISATVCVAGPGQEPFVMERTTNGGATWTAGQNVGMAIDRLRCTPVICIGVSQQPTIMVSTDQGVAWTSWAGTLPGLVAGSSNYALSDAVCVSATTCLVVGHMSALNESPASVVLRTTNSGQSWTVSTGLTATSSFDAIACPTATHCVTAGNAAVGNATTWAVSLSNNGGVSWTNNGYITSQGNAILTNVASLSCPSANVCYAVSPGVLVTTGGPAIVAKSTDGGGKFVTLENSDVLGSGSLYDIACTSTSRCVAAGFDAESGGSGVTLITSNGGQTWTPESVSTTASLQLNSVTCPTTTLCMVAGDQFARGVPASATPTTTTAAGSAKTPVLGGHGLGVASFGSPQSTVVAALGAALGQPTTSSSNVVAACPNGNSAYQWGSLAAIFNSSNTFVGYMYGAFVSSSSTPALSSAQGYTLGTSVAQIQAQNPTAQGNNSTYVSTSDGVLYEYDNGIVTSIEAGTYCGAP